MLKIFDLKTRMKNLFQIILALSALALMPVALAQPVFVHPGISHKKSDLERIKQMVEAQIDPWYSSYQEMAANSKSSYNYVVLGNSTMTELGRDSGVNYGAWNSDIRAAYYNAIRWVVTDDTRHADKAVESSGMDLLSDRELEVFQLVGRGLNSREIAEKLTLVPTTVDSYRARIKEKMGIKNAAELYQRAAQWVAEHGLQGQ